MLAFFSNAFLSESQSAEVRAGERTDLELVLEPARFTTLRFRLPDGVAVPERVRAEVRRNGHRYEVEDARSRNGTFVNGVGVQQGEARLLVSGDRLLVGGFFLNFHDPASTVVADSSPGLVLDDRFSPFLTLPAYPRLD